MFLKIFTPFDWKRAPQNKSVNFQSKFVQKVKIESFCGIHLSAVNKFSARQSPFLFIHFRRTDFYQIVNISDCASDDSEGKNSNPHNYLTNHHTCPAKIILAGHNTQPLVPLNYSSIFTALDSFMSLHYY